MEKLEVFKIAYKGAEYDATCIPDVFTNIDDNYLIIGSHSLNLALYDDEERYPDGEALCLDERIYAFIDDEYFHLGYEDFLAKVKKYLD